MPADLMSVGRANAGTLTCRLVRSKAGVSRTATNAEAGSRGRYTSAAGKRSDVATRRGRGLRRRTSSAMEYRHSLVSTRRERMLRVMGAGDQLPRTTISSRLIEAVFGLLVVATVFTVPATAVVAGDGATDVEPTVWVEDPRVLSCSPTALDAGETLVLQLGSGHGAELAILREVDGTVFFLVVQAPPSGMKALMSREAFSESERVEIPTDSIGYVWEEGRGNERIFDRTSRYTLYTSDALESEIGGHRCSVTYTAREHEVGRVSAMSSALRIRPRSSGGM